MNEIALKNQGYFFDFFTVFKRLNIAKVDKGEDCMEYSAINLNGFE